MRQLIIIGIMVLWVVSTHAAVVVQDTAATTVRAAADTTGITITHGFTLANNDVLYALLAEGDDFGTTCASSSGGTWTELIVQKDAIGNDHLSCILRRVVTNAGGEPSTYTFTIPDGNSEENLALLVVQVRGANVSGTPEDATTTGTFGLDDSRPDNVTIATVTADAFVLIAHLAVGVANQMGTATAGVPSTWTLVDSVIYEDAVNGTSLFWEVASKTITSPGTVTPGTWNMSINNTIFEFSTYAVAVKPAAVGSTRRRMLVYGD